MNIVCIISYFLSTISFSLQLHFRQPWVRGKSLRGFSLAAMTALLMSCSPSWPMAKMLLSTLSGKEKRESNMPSISKWGNAVKDARQRESCSLGGYESSWAPGGAIFIPGEIMTRTKYWKPFFSQLNQFLSGAADEHNFLLVGSKLASSTSSAPLQVHRGGGNPLNIVPLHSLTILYYYLLIPPALLITILFHVCPRSLVSFRVEEGGSWANNLWRYKSLSSRRFWSSSRGEVNLTIIS